jgi:hypothetical protein
MNCEIFNESLPALRIPLAMISDDDNLIAPIMGEIFSALFTREHRPVFKWIKIVSPRGAPQGTEGI